MLLRLPGSVFGKSGSPPASYVMMLMKEKVRARRSS
jgi:hypothetical protein